MGLLQGTVTFSKYRVVGSLPEKGQDFFNEQIRRFAFREALSSAAETALGWTSLENVLDTDFTHAHYALGPFFLFALRIDRKVVPPSLLKIRVLEEEGRLRRSEDQKKLYRHQREEVRERVRLALLGKVQPVPSFYDVCWAVPEGSLLFGSHADRVINDFQDLFKQSFQLTLSPFLPWDGPGMDPALASAFTEEDRRVMGREFLTWLWFKSEERDGHILIPEVGDVELHFGRRIVLASGEGEYAESVVCQGLHAELQEGKEALRHGKKIREARLRLKRETAEAEFTFKADAFLFQSLKLGVGPETLEEDEDRDGRTLERIYLVEQVVKTMEELFALYAGLRGSAQWAALELPRMEKWFRR